MIDGLTNNKVYVVKVCAETDSVSVIGSTHVGEASQSEEVWLPFDTCGSSFHLPIYDGAELSAGMIGGAVCAILFLLLAIIGFVVWR